MLKTLTREITLSIQARNGASPAVMLWFGVIMLAMLAAFVFLCVAGYDWLALQFGSVLAGLIMAGVFVAIAILAAIVCALIRRRAGAARQRRPSW